MEIAGIYGQLDRLPGTGQKSPMSTGEIVTAIVGALVAIGAIALFVDARHKRRAAERSQTHSNVKPLQTHERSELIQKGGLGSQGLER